MGQVGARLAVVPFVAVSGVEVSYVVSSVMLDQISNIQRARASTVRQPVQWILLPQPFKVTSD